MMPLVQDSIGHANTDNGHARVAILLACYNGARYLAEQIESIRLQDQQTGAFMHQTMPRPTIHSVFLSIIGRCSGLTVCVYTAGLPEVFSGTSCRSR